VIPITVNADFLVLMIPVNFQVDEAFLPRVLPPGHWRVQRNFFEEMKPRLESYGIGYLDLLQKMKERPGSYFPPNGEVHFTAAGHHFAAACLKEYLDGERKGFWV
jgi:hypothetical protein